MPERIQFHLDENVDSKIARALMRYGIDVTMSAAVGLRSASDEVHLAFAQREQRVIFTHDDDFLRLVSKTSDHAGIVFSIVRQTVSTFLDEFDTLNKPSEKPANDLVTMAIDNLGGVSAIKADIQAEEYQRL